MLLLASSVCGLFKWRQFEPEVILLAVGWYLRFSLSYCDVEELPAERGLHADHVTVWRLGPALRPEKWNDVCARGPNRPTTVGGWTRALPVSCGGFFRRDPRLSPFGQAG